MLYSSIMNQTKKIINADGIDHFDPEVRVCSSKSCADILPHNIIEFDISTKDYIYEDVESIQFYLCSSCVDKFKSELKIEIINNVQYDKFRDIEINITKAQASVIAS